MKKDTQSGNLDLANIIGDLFTVVDLLQGKITTLKDQIKKLEADLESHPIPSILDRSTPLEDGVYHLEWVDDNHVRLTHSPRQ